MALEERQIVLLEEADPIFVSLVTAGANRKTFKVIKFDKRERSLEEEAPSEKSEIHTDVSDGKGGQGLTIVNVLDPKTVLTPVVREQLVQKISDDILKGGKVRTTATEGEETTVADPKEVKKEGEEAVESGGTVEERVAQVPEMEDVEKTPEEDKQSFREMFRKEMGEMLAPIFKWGKSEKTLGITSFRGAMDAKEFLEEKFMDSFWTLQDVVINILADDGIGSMDEKVKKIKTAIDEFGQFVVGGLSEAGDEASEKISKTARELREKMVGRDRSAGKTEKKEGEDVNALEQLNSAAARLTDAVAKLTPKIEEKEKAAEKVGGEAAVAAADADAEATAVQEPTEQAGAEAAAEVAAAPEAEDEAESDDDKEAAATPEVAAASEEAVKTQVEQILAAKVNPIVDQVNAAIEGMNDLVGRVDSLEHSPASSPSGKSDGEGEGKSEKSEKVKGAFDTLFTLEGAQPTAEGSAPAGTRVHKIARI